MYTIHTTAELEKILQGRGCSGSTPLVENMLPFLQGNINGKPCEELLLTVFTDGSPNGGFNQLASAVRGKSKNVYCSFVMCTNEDDVVEQYNKVVDPIPGCDITDDFKVGPTNLPALVWFASAVCHTIMGCSLYTHARGKCSHTIGVDVWHSRRRRRWNALARN
jgi:hypothetical protein